MTSVTLVVPTLRRPRRLAQTLDAVSRLSPGPNEVLVVDGDPQQSAAAVAQEADALSAWPTIHVPCPTGLTRQRNRGLDRASGSVVTFLDDDATPEPSALRELLLPYADSSVVGTSGRVVEPTSHTFVGQRSRLRLLFGSGPEGTMTAAGYPRRIVHVDREHDLEFMSGCFMSARTEVARRVRFDEALPGYGLAEDEDFGWRMSRQGRLRYVPSAVVHHDNGGFLSRKDRAFGRTVVVHRAYLFRKNFPQTRSARVQFWLCMALLIGHRALNGELAGVLGALDGVRAVRHGAAEMLRDG